MELEQVKLLDVKPGQVLVVNMPEPAEVEVARSLARWLRNNLPGVLVLILPSGYELSVAEVPPSVLDYVTEQVTERVADIIADALATAVDHQEEVP